MAIRVTEREDDEQEEESQEEWDEQDESESSDDRAEGRNGRADQRQLARLPRRRALARRRPAPGGVFDAHGAIRVGRLRLARTWRESGSIYQAIHAYTEVLVRYPDTGVASAAVEELMEMAESLAQQGRFYAALGIFNKLEELY